MTAETLAFLAPSPVEPASPGDFQRLRPLESSEQERTLRHLADAVHRLNLAVVRAVDSGLSVEFVRASRHHNGAGAWGDQMVPMVRER